MVSKYSTDIFDLFIIIVTVVVQSIVEATSKAAKTDAVAGKMDKSLGHDSFVSRANRTFANSNENISILRT